MVFAVVMYRMNKRLYEGEGSSGSKADVEPV